jgi:hypothetical protein
MCRWVVYVSFCLAPEFGVEVPSGLAVCFRGWSSDRSESCLLACEQFKTSSQSLQASQVCNSVVSRNSSQSNVWLLPLLLTQTPTPPSRKTVFAECRWWTRGGRISTHKLTVPPSQSASVQQCQPGLWEMLAGSWGRLGVGRAGEVG